ncbi:MAG: Xylose isomerase-like TIM barrel [Candidatus Bathyarchaeota archaeon BA1]|nr:MAG: Xylose isomerase-like TIM barrel [Candidatus Bathyarchaeota archaeon BA1]
MKIGINMHSHAVGGSKLALREQLDLFTNVGFDCVELMPDSLNLIRNGILDKRGCSSVLDILSSYDFLYTTHAPLKANLANASLVRISEGIIKACIGFSVLINARILVLHAGFVVPSDKFSIFTRPLAGALMALIDSMRRCAEYASNSGISIGIENGELGATHLFKGIDSLLDVVEAIDMDNVGVALDIGHLYLTANYYGFDLLEATEKALTHMIHAHLSDNFGKFDPLSPYEKDLPYGYGDLHLPIGLGNVPYKDILELIKPVYKGVYILDIDPEYKDFYPLALKNLKELLEGS